MSESNRLKNSKGNTLTFILVMVMGIAVLAFRKCNTVQFAKHERIITQEAGDWRHHKIIYTKHARCRMECRDISEDEVEDIVQHGVINESKSREADDEAKGNCPTIALEGNTSDGQHVRIVLAACEKTTRIVTAIDIDKEHDCNCR